MKMHQKLSRIFAFPLILSCLILLSACHSQTSVPATTQAMESTTECVVQEYIASHLSKEETEAFTKEVKQELFNGDWEDLSQKIKYPICIDNTVYNSSDELLTNAEQIQANFVPEFWNNLEEETCIDMFNNSEGIMLGRGQVWLASILHENGTKELLIIAINNDGF